MIHICSNTLYEKYSSDGKDCLIGAPYYGVYKYVLKTALMCVVIGLVIAQFILLIIDLYSGAAAAVGVTGAVETSIEVIINWIVQMIDRGFQKKRRLSPK